VALFTGIRIYAHQRAPRPPVPPEAGPSLLRDSHEASAPGTMKNP
jgi:hypothetical protein